MVCFRLGKAHFITGLILLSGCVSLPKDQQTQNLLVPPSLEKSIENGLATDFFSMGNWPSEKWWEIFNSPQLNGLIKEALGDNPSLQSIERRVEFAKQTAKVTRSRLFPLLNFDADETWELLSKHGLYRAFNPKLPIDANLVDLTLSFTYEFDFWGKNRNLYRADLGREKAEEAETAQVALLTTTAVAQAYFALKINLIRKRLFQELFEVRSAIFKLQNFLQEKALLSKLLPLFSEEQVMEAEKLVYAIAQEVETDKHLINILIGRGPDLPLEIDDSLPYLDKNLTIPSNLSFDLLSRRPDLMAQIWRCEAIAHDVGAAKADFYPNINLVGLIGLESTLYRFLFNKTSKRAALEPAIHLPIFTAGAIRANIRAQKALFDEAVQTYNNLILNSAQEVADLIVIAQAIFEKQISQEEILKDAQERYDLTQLRYEQGLDNLLAVFFVEEEWIQKELDNVTLLYDQYVATIKLIKALGGGYQSEYGVPLRAKEEES